MPHRINMVEIPRAHPDRSLMRTVAEFTHRELYGVPHPKRTRVDGLMRDLRDRITIVAFDVDEQMLGVAGLLLAPRCGTIVDVATCAKRRGEGLGRRVVTHLEEVAAAKGAERLLVDDVRPKAVGFYERLRYEKTGIGRQYAKRLKS